MSSSLSAAAHSRTQSRLGTTLSGRWRLDSVLGVGGMGAVFEAQHRNGNRVAIKILHPELALDSSSLRRFLREGHLANAVDHPGVVKVLDDGVTDEGLPFLVMEFLEGESLDDRLLRLNRSLSLPDTLAIGVAMLDVLEAAHERNIIHRDIKPENVFLLSNGGIKLLDFGIASLIDSMAGGMRGTNPDTLVGTPTFMPREQAQGKQLEIDGQSDLWSVGATLFYALTQQFIYEASSVAEFIQLLMSQQPRPLSALVPTIPAPIAAVIHRAMQHDKSARWASAGAMKQALIEAAQEASIEIPPFASLEGFTVHRQRDSRVSLADWSHPAPTELPQTPARRTSPETETLAAGPTLEQPSESQRASRQSVTTVPPTSGTVSPPHQRARYALFALLPIAALFAFWMVPRSSPQGVSSAAVPPAVPTPSASVVPEVTPPPSASSVTLPSPPPSASTRPRSATPRTTAPARPTAAGDEDLGTSRYLAARNGYPPEDVGL